MRTAESVKLFTRPKISTRIMTSNLSKVLAVGKLVEANVTMTLESSHQAGKMMRLTKAR
jgi:hypothetical protein